MEWKHLPESGGIYDQSPFFIERMLYLMQAEAEEEKRKEAHEKRGKGNTLGKPPRKPRR